MDEQALLLHQLRVRGPVKVPDGPAVDGLIADGLAVRRKQLLALTARGRELHAARARLPAGFDEHTQARRAFESFGRLNDELLRVCHDWQLRPGGVPNDHTDAEYDWAVIERLGSLDEKMGPVVRRLGVAVARFDCYRPRLRAALGRVRDGEHEWFTSPRCDSYHTVWMQLHEDLLVALGLARGEESE
jgi:hypothetical protein